MSSITGLISAGGGGGGADSHIVTDPKKLTRIGGGYYYIKTNNGSTSPLTQSAFWTGLAYSDHTAQVDTTTSDTYVTLLDVTSSNGGYLHWVLSNGIASPSGESATVKFTVDGGTPVEITYQPPAAAFTNLGFARMFIGGGLSTIDLQTSSSYTSFTGANDFWNSYKAYGFSSNTTASPATWDDATNNVYGMSNWIGGIQCDFAVLSTMPYQRLEFTSDLKIEVKHSTYSTSGNHHKAACFYTLF